MGSRGEIKEPVLAEKLDCSTRLVRWILKGFQRCNLIEIKSYNGQGRGIRITNFWLEKAEEIKKKLRWKRAHQKEREYLKSRNSRQFQVGRNPLDCFGIPKGVITKGSRTTRYFMYKLRKFVENSHLAGSESVICGRLFNHLEGKTASKGRKWLSRFKSAARVDWSLTDFFVWLHKLKKAEEEEKRRKKRNRKKQKRMERQREKARESWEKNPPPRLEEVGSFDALQEAMDQWKEEKEDA